MLMTCRNVRQLHDAFVDSELSSSLMAEVHAHLLQCPECQHEVELLRATADVLALDRSEPMLDSGFASRVIAQMPKTVTVVEVADDESEQHASRQRFMRIFAKGFIPAAAAALFLSVWIWPSFERTDAPGRVLGTAVAVDASGVKSVVSPTLDAVADTQQAARNLNQLLQFSVNQAGQGVRQNLSRKDLPTSDDVSLLDMFLQPFNGMIQGEEDPEPTDGPEVIKF
jgi:anti-sigma factor RsiW